MADIHWIKLKTSMFDDEKIRLIEAMPEADSILIIWVRLLVLAGKTNDDGLIYIQRDMPYTNESLATLFNKKVSVVTLAINLLVKFNMIDVNDEGLLEVTNWEKHQNVEQMEHVRKLTAARTKRYRENKKMKQISDANGDVTVTSRDATDSDSDSEEPISRAKVNFKKLFEFLNNETGRKFHDTDSNRKLITARLNDGFSKSDIQDVIRFKSSQWKNDPAMRKYLRPNTLFAPSHFDDYLNEAHESMPHLNDNRASLSTVIKQQINDYGDDTDTILINLQQLGYKVTRKGIEDERNREQLQR